MQLNLTKALPPSGARIDTFFNVLDAFQEGGTSAKTLGFSYTLNEEKLRANIYYPLMSKIILPEKYCRVCVCVCKSALVCVNNLNDNFSNKSRQQLQRNMMMMQQ